MERLANDTDSSEDELDIIVQQIMDQGPRANNPRRLLDLDGSPHDFRRRFRMSKEVFAYILNRTSARLQHTTQRNRALTPKEQLLSFFHVIGTNSLYHVMRDVHGPSASTICRVVKRVAVVIVEVLEQETIKFPSRLNEDVEKFHSIANMPSCIGAVDGTHVKVQPPALDEASYLNRHHTHSLNVLILSSASHNISFVSSKCPGSWHDSRVLRMSSLWETMEVQGTRPFPGAYILGDSAYPCRPWLIPPIPETRQLTPQESRFNRNHKRTRAVVERTIGILKQRFRILLETVRLRDMESVAVLVKALCIVHNLCIGEGDQGEGLEPIPQQQGNQDPNDLEDGDGDNGPQGRRAQLVARF